MKAVPSYFRSNTSVVLGVTPSVTNQKWHVVFEDGREVVVPAGSPTDFASIPWFLRLMLPRFHEDYARAAVVHDYLYRGGVIKDPVEGIRYPTREEADLFFYWVAIADDTQMDRAYIMYAGVRLGGWLTWRRHEKNRVSLPKSLGSEPEDVG